MTSDESERMCQTGLHLKIKKTKFMTTEKHVDNEDTEIFIDFAYILLVIDSNGDCN